MRVAIAGGHGSIAMLLARRLMMRGDDVRSLIRNPEHEADITDAGAEPVLCDLEAAGDDEVAEAVSGCHAVVFAAGAGPGSGAERKHTMDLGGAVKLIAAARANGIERYLMVSSMGADADAEGDDDFAAYQRAKGRADDELIASGLAYTIVRPTHLTDDPGTGLVELGDGLGRGEIPRDDVAAILEACLHERASVGKLFEAASGERPIADAIAAL